MWKHLTKWADTSVPASAVDVLVPAHWWSVEENMHSEMLEIIEIPGLFSWDIADNF